MSFADDIKKFAEKTNNTIDEVVVHFILDLSERVIVKTPVETGWAKNNWVATVGAPNTGVPNSADKLGQDALNGVLFTALSALGKVYYLTNNVEYINVLEYGGFPNPPKQGTGLTAGGFSLKAPRGMARLGVMAAKKEMMRKVRRGYGSVR
jgi:hypothetical protein